MKMALWAALTTALRRAKETDGTKGTEGTQMTRSRSRNSRSNTGARQRVTTTLRVVASLMAALAMALGAALTTGVVAHAAPAAISATYSYTGAEQTFTVPKGVTSISVDAIGGAGGAGFGGSTGGPGSEVTGNMTVTVGQVLYVEVGGAAQTSPTCFPGAACIGGFNGGGQSNFGGGGGGASDVRTISSAASGALASRLVVAAGGGGGGAGGSCPATVPGGNGGAGAADGGMGTSCSDAAGGAGGQAGTAGLGVGESPTNDEAGAGGGGLNGGAGGGNPSRSATTSDYGADGGGGGGTNLIPASGALVGPSAGGNGSVTISYSPPGGTTPTGTTTKTATLAVNGGSLTATTLVSPTLSASLSGLDQTVSYQLPIFVTDATGTGAGWNLTLTSTQFSTSGGSNTLATDASVLTDATASCWIGSTCTSPANSVSYPLGIPAGASAPTPVKIFNAAVGTGLGTVNITPAVNIFLPANTYAGTYTSTLSLAIIAGP